MTVFEELKLRGLIAQCTNEEKVKELVDNEKISFYIGFDPTADSLHVGHFLQMVIMRHLQRAGHRPIILFGGGTGFIGDPSGKTDMRKMMNAERIKHNVECFKKQMSRFIDFSCGKALMVNNADWLKDLNYIDFLREVGVHFSVNRMLSAECYKARLEKGLTFFELNYMIMQSYDFYVLNRDYSCVLQLGGDDQWSNIIGGVELVRRKAQKEVFGLTFTLLTKSDGKKMGKTESGAVWLDENKTSVYDFYQYWRNIDDADVIKCLKMLTFIPLGEIEKLSGLKGEDLNEAKKILALELTKMVHGEEKALVAQSTATNLFSKKANSENMPCKKVTRDIFTDGNITVVDLLVKVGLTSSKSEARRLIEQGGIEIGLGGNINSLEKVLDVSKIINAGDFSNGFIVIKKGKKVYFKVEII